MISFNCESNQTKIYLVSGSSGENYYSIRITDQDGTRDYLVWDEEQLKFSDGIKSAKDLYKSLQTKL
ncbi:MAG: hypothetical protein N3D75_02270 [Candidatus Aenigmarchaeota archaeon]|nr:hypothetical protein [Candidatus Aenigmarchaeota archaeon]